VELLADESCAGPVIRALRAAGHDLVAISEVAKGAGDEAVMERAFADGRVLITEDRDFGELVYASARPTAGVVFVKFHSHARRSKPGRSSKQSQNWANDCGVDSRSSNPEGFGRPNDHRSNSHQRTKP